MKAIAIFASGKGSNAKNIIEHFLLHPGIKIALIVSSHKDAGVLNIAKSYGIPSLVLNRAVYYGSGGKLLEKLNQQHIKGIVLAGFIWLIPKYLIEQYPNRIINIHPALLPKYGGHGMYGMHIHEAVWSHREKETGITVHVVNERYDDGKIIFQARVPIDAQEMPFDIAQKVQALEQLHYPMVIQSFFETSI